MKCWAVLVTFMEAAVKGDGENIIPETSKVLNEKLLEFTKADGLYSDGANSRESLTARS